MLCICTCYQKGGRARQILSFHPVSNISTNKFNISCKCTTVDTFILIGIINKTAHIDNLLEYSCLFLQSWPP